MLSRWIGGGLARTTTLVAASLIAFTAMAAFHPDTADAKRRTHHASAAGKASGHAKHGRNHRTRQSGGGALPNDMINNPRYAAIVVDVKTGRTLYEAAPNALRHPASITKVMTLYLLFEQLQAGRISLSTPLPVSAHAAAQSPTKLGLRPGTTIRVDDAIKGIVTRSANDAAVVVAEALGGSESSFAALMTRKARALGMTRTRYVNASGLPDNAQITTAHDLAILGMAIQKRFPVYFRYFSTRSFVFRGREIGNHNRLLGSVDGVDGIKTGYTNASGFNLLTSIKRDNRQLVAVVMGGRSAASRDVVMRRLVDAYMPRAYAGKASERPAPAIADAADDARASSVAMAPASLPAARPASIAEPAKPRVVASVASAPARPQTDDDRQDSVAPAAKTSIGSTAPTMRWVQGPTAAATTPAEPSTRTAFAAETAAPETTATVQMARVQTIATGSPSRSGWIIQIGATDSENAARRLLASARTAANKPLASATPFTETVNRNGSKLWRARFGGFDDQQEALAACSSLKAASFTCVAVKL